MIKKDNQFRLYQLISKSLWLWIVAWVLGLITVGSILGLAMLSGWFLTMAAASGLLIFGGHALNYMLPAAIIRGLAFLRTIGRYGDLMVSHHAVFGLLKKLRVEFFRKYASLSFLDRQATNQTSSQKMHKLVKDIDILNEFTLRFISPWVMALGAALLVSFVMMMTPQIGKSLVALWLSFMVAIIALYQGISLAKQENAINEQRQVKLLDTLPSLTQLLIWQSWQTHVEQLKNLDEQHTKIMLKTHRIRRLGMVAIQILISLAAFLFLWAVGELFQGQVTVFTVESLNRYQGMNVAFALAIFLGLVGLSEFVQNLVSEPLALGRSLIAKNRLNALIAKKDNPMTQLPLDDLFNNSLTLDLKQFSVQAPKAVFGTKPVTHTITNQRPCLIMGASGSGKSTLLQTLALEFYPKSGQAILQGDLGCADWMTVDFSNRLGFLGQSIDIFDQTLADNLRLGKFNATNEELYAVLDKVNLGDWVKAQPKGLDTPLGEYGAAISGGQARRIALARLLLSKKAVLLLDEPFAGLDNVTRQVVWQSLLQAQSSGQIGLLLISTHQIWEQMQEVDILRID